MIRRRMRGWNGHCKNTCGVWNQSSSETVEFCPEIVILRKQRCKHLLHYTDIFVVIYCYYWCASCLFITKVVPQRVTDKSCPVLGDSKKLSRFGGLKKVVPLRGTETITWVCVVRTFERTNMAESRSLYSEQCCHPKHLTQNVLLSKNKSIIKNGHGKRDTKNKSHVAGHLFCVPLYGTTFRCPTRRDQNTSDFRAWWSFPCPIHTLMPGVNFGWIFSTEMLWDIKTVHFVTQFAEGALLRVHLLHFRYCFSVQRLSWSTNNDLLISNQMEINWETLIVFQDFLTEPNQSSQRTNTN